MAKTDTITKTLGITDVYEQRDAAEYFEKILLLTSPGASEIFKGELNHKTRCLQCEKSNDSRSFFWILPLVVEDSHHKTYSVQQGMCAFLKGEKVSEDNGMYCNQCHDKREAEITCEITQNPEILTLLLKRFRFDNKRRCYIKLHCKVDVPQTLHVKSCTYDLYALVNHYGNLTGGHYVAEIKSFETGEWYYFNDDTVKMVRQPEFGTGNSSVRSCTAYLLMYRKGRTHSENADEDDYEAQCAYSDEGRCEEAARGEDLVPHHQLKDEHNNKVKNVKHVNGDISEKRYDDTVWMKHKTSAGEVEKQLKQTVARQTEADGDIYKPSLLTPKSKISKMPTDKEQHTPNRQRHDRNSKKSMCHVTARGPPTQGRREQHIESRFEQKPNFSKQILPANGITWEGQNNIVSQNRLRTVSVTNSSPTGNTVNPPATKVVKNKQDSLAVKTEVTSIRQRTNTDVSAGNSYAKSFHVLPNGCCPPSPPSCTGHSHSQGRMNEPTVNNFIGTNKKGSNLQRNNKMQYFVAPHRSSKVEATQGEKPTNVRTRKIKNKSENKVQKPRR